MKTRCYEKGQRAQRPVNLKAHREVCHRWGIPLRRVPPLRGLDPNWVLFVNAAWEVVGGATGRRKINSRSEVRGREGEREKAKSGMFRALTREPRPVPWALVAG